MPDVGVINPRTSAVGASCTRRSHLLSERGLLVGNTKIESTTLFGGVHGGVSVTMFDGEE